MARIVKTIVALVVIIVAGMGYVYLSTRSVSEGGERATIGSVFAERATVRIAEAAYTARVEVARSATDRERGLSGRNQLAPTSGMLFVFDGLDHHGIWMPGMRFSIDVIWIAGGAVVDTTERLPVPVRGETYLPIFRPAQPAFLALEVPAGTVARRGIRNGQRVEVQFDGG